MARKKKEDLYQGDLFDLFGEQEGDAGQAAEAASAPAEQAAGTAGQAYGNGQSAGTAAHSAKAERELSHYELSVARAASAASSASASGPAATAAALADAAAFGSQQVLFAGASAAKQPRLSEHLRLAALQELKLQETSARAVCETLIKKHGASDKRYVTEKPYIFADVCRYLDQLCAEGQCELMSQDPADRHYRWLG
ncbi:hypothetical protein SY83_04205 [Paenibacillus swuensis]|uniref:Uncharacterized protein n=1 Tax=Paenibacillus swuensis TaxID=1178515 RepID=A0A172TFS0_9BACL|nr:DUF3895 domain-containing protein [Paenibacillus swuensis]ANE45633.1 hypothetical protein SY83_04205 [Paenibacillus swuensis]